MPSLRDVVRSYNDQDPLEQASTIPAAWYVDKEIAELERQAVFGRTWQVVARADQLQRPGQFVTAELADEPLVIVRGTDGQLRAFYNVCRHHAAAVVTERQGTASILRCPYHGWSYGLDGALKGTPEFDGVCGFDRSQNGLVPVRIETWEQFIFVKLDPGAQSLQEFLGHLVQRVAPLNLSSLHFFERRAYSLNCNWKVFVDNYLDGGYRERGLLLSAVKPDGLLKPRRCDVSNPRRGPRLVLLAVPQLHDQSLQGLHGHQSCAA